MKHNIIWCLALLLFMITIPTLAEPQPLPSRQANEALSSKEITAYEQYQSQFQQALLETRSAQWRLALKQFLAESHPLAQKHPELQALWVNRAKAALLLFDPVFGTEAALTLKTNPEFNDQDSAHLELLTQLKNNGWLDSNRIPDFQEQLQLEIAAYRHLTSAEKRLILTTEQGYAQQKTHLGVLYAQGRQVPRNYQKCLYWYTKAAEQGEPFALYNLANLYAIGPKTYRNLPKALSLYEQSAKKGNTEAWTQLGYLYSKGRGVPKDPVKAVDYFQRAANQGSTIAQYNLAEMYLHGRGGVAKDDKKAFEWYQKAALQGDAKAQVNVGYFYENGKGVPQNDQRAYYWYQKAAEQGNGTGRTNMEILRRQGRF